MRGPRFRNPNFLLCSPSPLRSAPKFNPLHSPGRRASPSLRLLFSIRLGPPRAPKPTMAGDPPSHRKRKAPVPAAAAEDEAEAETQELRREVEELEEGLADLDRRILKHLRGTSTRLADAAVARLVALRPLARLESPTAETSIVEREEEQLEKLNVLKSKVEANIAYLPKVLDKMKESVARCEKTENLNVNIHPVFRRKHL